MRNKPFTLNFFKNVHHDGVHYIFVLLKGTGLGNASVEPRMY